MSEGIDCLSPVSAQAAQQIKAGGKGFVLRYIGSKGGDSLSVGEIQGMQAAGLDVGLIYETSGQQALGGAGAGQTIGSQAVAAAQALGAPQGTCIYIAETDFDPGGPNFDANIAAIKAFYQASTAVCRASGYRGGAYGGLAAAQACIGIADLVWQTYAWSGGQWAASCALQQYQNGISIAGLDADADRATVSDWGQWGSHKEDFDMQDPQNVIAAARCIANDVFARPVGQDTMNAIQGDILNLGWASAWDKWAQTAGANGELNMVTRLDNLEQAPGATPAHSHPGGGGGGGVTLHVHSTPGGTTGQPQ